MHNGFLRVSLLQRGTFVKQPQKYPKRPCPGVRPSLRSGSLAPVPLRGHAATGHPWPIAALPASMPGDPLRETSTRPSEGAGRSRSKDREQARSYSGRVRFAQGVEILHKPAGASLPRDLLIFLTCSRCRRLRSRGKVNEIRVCTGIQASPPVKVLQSFRLLPRICCDEYTAYCCWPDQGRDF